MSYTKHGCIRLHQADESFAQQRCAQIDDIGNLFLPRPGSLPPQVQ